MSTENMLLFGASGAVGTAIRTMAEERGWDVNPVKRWDGLPSASPYTCVCWAQGINTNDSVYNLDIKSHLQTYDANCVYILETLNTLLTDGLLAKNARMVIISSIWQELSRPNKLSYSMSKSAIRGLVLSAAADLARDGHLINAILPGAMDTPMTIANLTKDQMNSLKHATGFDRLVTPADVASAVCYLCSAENTGITGQSITVDLGYSHVRTI